MPTPAAKGSLANERLAICYRCPQIRFHLGLAWCGTPVVAALRDGNACGCLLQVKTRVKNQRCPLGKWPGETKGERQ